ncbi:efflux RND transporter periplasmic adaptor subunit [Chloroflexota bacterium]
MKLSKVVLIVLVLCSVSVLSLGCASELDSTLEDQVVTVQRGNLTIDITAVGNLALSRTEDLAFDLFYQEGTVEEVLVEEGDTVEEGQLLARLDASEWEDELSALEDKVIAAERNVTAKERAVTAAERQVPAKEHALLQAQINLQEAKDNLDEVEEVAKLKDVVEDAEYDLRIARAMLGQTGTWEERSNWLYQIDRLEESVTEAEQELEEILAGSSVRVTTDEAIAVAMKKLEIEIAQGKVEVAQVAIEDAQIAIGDAQIALEDARKDLEDAQEELDEAKSKSPLITATFDGFITKVNVSGGDEVMKGKEAVTLADPAKFEADILVSEMDIFQVRLGGDATVQVDAMSEISLPAEVTHIAPTATSQQGVVNYAVKVEVQSLEEAMQEWQQTSDNISSGTLPERMKQAIEEGRLTPEQADEMMKQRQQAQVEQPGGQQRQVPTMLPEDFQLREGLTVIVSIIVDERNNVLLVPNSAITTQGRQTFVQVLAADGTLEQRAIQTGISDYQFTEVIDGLSEGEQVVVSQGTTTTPTMSQQRPPRGIVPGMGVPH